MLGLPLAALAVCLAYYHCNKNNSRNLGETRPLLANDSPVNEEDEERMGEDSRKCFGFGRWC